MKGYFYIHTNEEARDYKVLKCKTDQIDKLEVFIPAKKETVIGGLDFLDDYTKDVFKTAVEIDQRWVIDMAADRQKEICQSQSLNIFFPANVSKQELHAVHMMAWKKKVKTLYYLRSEAVKRAETVSDEALRQYIFDSMDEEDCLACEG